MNKMVSNKKYLIIVILLIILIGGIAIGAIMKNSELLSRIGITIKKEEETIVDGIYIKPYDNLGEKIKALVTITRVNGIDSIEYISDNGESIKLNCNQKQTVGIDIEVLINENHEFKVISNGEEKIETVSLKENYMDDYIVITKLDDVEELEYHQVAIDFKQQGEEYSNYYNFNTLSWKTYQDTIKVDMSNVNIDTLLNGEYDAIVYAQCVDKAGNTLRVSKTIPVTKRKNFDLFTNMDSSGRTNLNEYGLRVTTWAGTDSDWRWFQVRAMGGGHYHAEGGFSVGIVMDWNNPDIAFDNMTITFALYAEARSSRSGGKAIINYTDGTSTSSETGTYAGKGTVYRNVILQPDKNKQISNIQFVCSGSDGFGVGSWSRVQEVYFNGL